MGKRSNDAADKAYTNVIKLFKKENFSLADLAHVATLAMAEVEKFPQLSGPDKKRAVLRIVENVIDIYAPEDQQELIKAAALQLLPGIIEQIIAASKGQLDLNKITKSCSCFGK